MRDGAQPARPQVPEQHPALARARLEVACRVGDRDEVRLRFEPEGGGESRRARVILGEPVDVVVERVERRRGDDAGLAERAAEQVLALPRAFDQLGGAGERGTHRTAEPLREADGHRVGTPRPFRRRQAGTDGGVEEPRAVEMRDEPTLVRRVDRRLELVERPDAPAARAVRVLEHDDAARAEQMRLLRCDVLGRDATRLPRHAFRVQAGVDRRPAPLPDQDVGVLLGEEHRPRRRLRAKRDLVRHRRRRQEERRLVAEQLRHASLELVRRRVLEVLLVADLGGGHRRAHACGGLRQRVRAEIDHRATA